MQPLVFQEGKESLHGPTWRVLMWLKTEEVEQVDEKQQVEAERWQVDDDDDEGWRDRGHICVWGEQTSLWIRWQSVYKDVTKLNVCVWEWVWVCMWMCVCGNEPLWHKNHNYDNFSSTNMKYFSWGEKQASNKLTSVYWFYLMDIWRSVA